MEASSFWLTPLILMPGVGMLILSTSVRYNRLHDELHHLDHHPAEAPAMRPLLLRRGRLFRNALVSLYACVALLCIAALSGMGTAEWPDLAMWLVLPLTAVGVACLTFAAIELIRESCLSGHILEAHNHRHEELITP
ncbi:MAG: DUF2721 domain-containing protein [Bacteroidota bacterium]